MDFSRSEEQQPLKLSTEFFKYRMPRTSRREIEASDLGYSLRHLEQDGGSGLDGLAFARGVWRGRLTLLDLAILFKR